MKKHPQLHFEILPFQNQESTADYLGIADVELMKPGGAATAEALGMSVNTLIFLDPEHPWEECNKNQMVRHGIGTVIECMETIPIQFKEVLSKPKNFSYVPIDAEKRVPFLIDEAIKTFAVFHKTNALKMPSEKASSLTDIVSKGLLLRETTQIY